MTQIDDLSLARVHGGGRWFAPHPHLGKTVGEVYGSKPVPYGLWSLWGHKTPGQPAPPLGHEDGIIFTGYWRPGRDAVIVSSPEKRSPMR